MQRTISVFLVVGCLSLTTSVLNLAEGLGVAVAQSATPLVGIPHMSDEPDGPEVQKFPPGADKVYLVFDYETDSPVEIIAEVRSEAQQGAVIFTSRETYNGTGTANIEIEGPGSSAFPDGVYDTIIRFGENRFVTAGWEWVVGDVELPSEDTSGGQTPYSSLPERESGSSQSDMPPSSSEIDNQSSQSALGPAQTTPGLSPIVMAGIGVVILFLLAIIVWAVRGFMTAA